MPQSWPSQWTFLFILFIMSFIIIVIMTYFTGIKQISNSSISTQGVSSLTWQW